MKACTYASRTPSFNMPVKGQNRGLKPFSHQRKLSDPWFWLRDDTRKVTHMSNFEYLDTDVKPYAYGSVHAALGFGG